MIEVGTINNKYEANIPIIVISIILLTSFIYQRKDTKRGNVIHCDIYIEYFL